MTSRPPDIERAVSDQAVWAGALLRMATGEVPPEELARYGAPPLTDYEKELCRRLGHFVGGCPPYIWTTEMCELISHAVSSLPSEIILYEDSFPEDGCFHFASPLSLAATRPTTIGVDILLHGFVWKRVDGGLEVAGFQTVGVDDDGALKVASLPYGEGVRDWFSNHPVDEAMTRLGFTAAAIAQSKVSSILRNTVPRSVRRRHPEFLDSDIRTVTLRKAEPVESGRNRSVEWHHRWLVTGHWRRLEAGRATWVSPHIKGPVGLPFKPQRRTVFVVRR